MAIRSDDKIRTLSEVPLFAGCSKKELQAVARLCLPVTFNEGQFLTQEGTVGRECFVLVDGKATVTIGGETVGTVGPAMCVGEMSLLDGGPRTATVVAASPMAAYVLSPQEFRSLLQVNPTFTRKMAIGLAQRLREVEDSYVH